jgi:ketosteroid isomerase-like protein
LEGLAALSPEQLPAWLDGFWESDGDYYPVRGSPEARPCHGREQIVAFLAEYRAVWDAYRYEIKDVWAVADDRVLVHGHVSAEGRASGMPVEGDLNHCCWLRHGRFIRVEAHLTLRGALHALGLSGETLEAAGLRE